jgi:hypothetical protein
MSALGILITILIIVLILMFLRYLFSDPYTLQAMQDGKTTSSISASTLASNGSGVPSSNFAYSIWFYVNDWNYRYGSPKVIFGRMGSQSTNENGSVPGVSGADPCPAVVLGEVENNLSISLSCYPGSDQKPTKKDGNTVIHTCNVANIPIQKWVNLAISVYGRTMDVYIDGKLVRTCLLPGIANINNSSDIYITPSGGFNGWTSNLQYYPGPLNPQEVWNIYSKGYTGSYLNWSSMFNTYQVKLSIIENGQPKSSLTI